MYTHKKALGQHFLKDDNIIRKIIDALNQDAFTNLLEIGPGAGALTKELIRIPHTNFRAVEVDREKVDFLVHLFPGLEQYIIHQDFLQMELPFKDPFTVIGNFPYNISSQIVFKILDWKEHVPIVIGMFQKEVAQRIASLPGNKVYGVISVFVQASYDVEYLFDVQKESFNPQPKIQSGVIRLKRKEQLLQIKSERAFSVLVKTAFNQRRKTLRNAVSGLFPQDILKDDIFNKRAEALSVEDFAILTYKMQ